MLVLIVCLTSGLCSDEKYRVRKSGRSQRESSAEISLEQGALDAEVLTYAGASGPAAKSATVRSTAGQEYSFNTVRSAAGAGSGLEKANQEYSFNTIREENPDY